MADNNYLSQLVSGFLGAFITAMISKKNNDNNNALKYITEERQKWREEIRRIAEELYDNDSNYEQIKAKLQVRLNPIDKYDDEIIEKMDELIKNKNKNEVEKKKWEVIESISTLLKHDWERAKKEAKNDKNFSNSKVFVIYFTVVMFLRYNNYPIIINLEKLLINNFTTSFLNDYKIIIYIASILFEMAWISIIFNLLCSVINTTDRKLRIKNKLKEIKNYCLDIPEREDFLKNRVK